MKERSAESAGTFASGAAGSGVEREESLELLSETVAGASAARSAAGRRAPSFCGTAHRRRRAAKTIGDHLSRRECFVSAFPRLKPLCCSQGQVALAHRSHFAVV